MSSNVHSSASKYVSKTLINIAFITSNVHLSCLLESKVITLRIVFFCARQHVVLSALSIVILSVCHDRDDPVPNQAQVRWRSTPGLYLMIA